MGRLSQISFYQKLLLCNLIIVAVVLMLFSYIYVSVDTFIYSQTVALGLNNLEHSVDQFEDILYDYSVKSEMLKQDSEASYLLMSDNINTKDYYYYYMRSVLQQPERDYLGDNFSKDVILWFPYANIF